MASAVVRLVSPPISSRILSTFCHAPSRARNAPISKWPVAMSIAELISTPLADVFQRLPVLVGVVDDEVSGVAKSFTTPLALVRVTLGCCDGYRSQSPLAFATRSSLPGLTRCCSGSPTEVITAPPARLPST